MIVGRLIAEVFVFVGAILAIAGGLLLLVQYLASLWTDEWHPISIFNTSGDKCKIGVAVMVFIWIAAEAYERGKIICG